MTEASPTRPNTARADNALTGKPLPAAAQRALAEAAVRRTAYDMRAATMPKEIGGRGGKEPGRYGDWEVKGLTSDF
jgi:hypothetical protein